jgi:hypothetical protein
MKAKTRAPLRTAEDTYTIEELCARYHCSRDGIYRRIKKLGFPPGDKAFKRRTWAKSVVHAWERKYMPGLHEHDPVEQVDEQAGVWEAWRREAQPILDEVKARRRPYRRAH